jgi:hypothetical protein
MNIYVTNLTYTTTEEELSALFEPYGRVESVRIITDRATGRSRGFGFVETLLLGSGVLGSTVVQEGQYLFKAIEK